MSEVLNEAALTVTPYPQATTRWDYYQAQYVNTLLEDAAGDADKTAAIVTRYIFETHPDVLDLPPTVLHRFQQAQRVMTTCAPGTGLLEGHILNHFEEARRGLQAGYATAVTATAISADPARPQPVWENGKWVQRFSLPESTQAKTLVWNQWVQERIKNGELEDTFSAHPQWVAVKLAEGSWLPAGNLMIELAEGLARVRTPAHEPHHLEERWGLCAGSEWGAGLDQWFAMSHIMDKELLLLASHLGSDMIDGMKLTPQVYARSYLPMLELMRVNPDKQIRGVLSDGTWAYSSELAHFFPDQTISKLHDLAGDVVDIGTAKELGMDAQIVFATHDLERRTAYLEDRYKVPIAARFIGPAGMQDIVDRFCV